MKLNPLLAALALTLCGCVSEITQLVDDSRIQARIGILSCTQTGKRPDLQMLKKALAFYSQQKVDAVVLIGPFNSGALVARSFLDSSTRLITNEGRHEVKGLVFAITAKRPVDSCETLTFYGGCRRPLTDELCFYPRTSLAVSAGSMSGIDLPVGIDDTDLKSRVARAAQGLLVSYYGDRTVIRRLDFTQPLPMDENAAWRVQKERLAYAEDVAEPWVLVASGLVEQETPPPDFPSDATLAVLPGFTARGEEIRTVHWPAVLRRTSGARARWYEVGVAFADTPEQQFLRRTVLSPSFHLSEDRDRTGVRCIFKASDLPSAAGSHRQAVFTVTPIGDLGAQGRTLSSAPIELRQQ